MKKKIVLVMGPTASGKSDLTQKLAHDLFFEIIVCDAFQVYKEISIGVNKPKNDLFNKFKIHMVNIISIYEKWNINLFKDKFDELVLNNPNKNFIVEGGSNLYIHSLVNNYNLKKLDDNLNFDNLSTAEAYNELLKIDEIEAIKIGKNNHKKLIHALKIIKSNNNQKKSDLDLLNKDQIYDFFLIRINIDRKKLYKKINDRADEMIKNGWINEVKALIEKDPNLINSNAFKALGYRNISELILNKENDYNFCIEKIKQQTRRYAKQQETWLNNKFKFDYNFFEYDQYEELKLKVKNFIDEK